jgi:hypothetical protein
MKCEHIEGQSPVDCSECKKQLNTILYDLIDRGGEAGRWVFEVIASRVAKAEIRLALGLLDDAIHGQQENAANEAWRGSEPRRGVT